MTMDNYYEQDTGWFTIEGRARRREFWTKKIVLAIIGLTVALPMMAIPLGKILSETSENDSSLTQAWLWVLGGFLVALAIGLLSIPVTIRRYHDRNMAGWWFLIFFVLECTGVGAILAIVEFIILYCLDGTPGPNNYGPDPKGRGVVEEPKYRRNMVIRTSITRQVPTAKPIAKVPDPQSRLSKLKDLLGKGLISEEEYEQKRSHILEEI